MAPPSAESFHVMAKPIGPICNLDCAYCFYLEKEKLYPEQRHWAMSEQVLEAFIKQKLAANTNPVEIFAWQGGEPTLLGVDYFQKVVLLQKKYAAGKKVENTIQTNGVLLTDQWCEFFAENGFLVGISIDGPREYHDRYRVNKGGQPTFDAVLRGIDLLKKHQVEFNTLTVVQRHNSQAPLQIYNFLKQVGSRFMQFIPVVERLSTSGPAGELTLVSADYQGECVVSEWSVEPKRFGSFLITIFDEWVRNDVGDYFVHIFDVSLESWLGLPQGSCVFRETCGKALAIEHNGDLYSCDHYVYPENRLGNIMQQPLGELVNSSEQRRFGEDKKDSLPQYCRQCEVRFACNGECPKHRFLTTPDGEPGLNYLCAGYKRFFTHVAPYMRFMANEIKNGRAPANVKAWARQKEQGFPQLHVKRNAPCPCGSRMKYKICCGRVG